MWLKTFLDIALNPSSNPDEFMKSCEAKELIMAIDACICILKTLHSEEVSSIPSSGITAKLENETLNINLDENAITAAVKDHEKLKSRLWKTIQHALALLKRFDSIDFSLSYALSPNLNLIHELVALCQNPYRSRMILLNIPHEGTSETCCCPLHDSVIRCIKTISMVTFETLFFQKGLQKDQQEVQIKLWNRYRKSIFLEGLTRRMIHRVYEICWEFASVSTESVGHIISVLNALYLYNGALAGENHDFVHLLGCIAEHVSNKKNFTQLIQCFRLTPMVLRNSNREERETGNMKALIRALTADISWLTTSDVKPLCDIFKNVTPNCREHVESCILKLLCTPEFKENRPVLMKAVQSRGFGMSISILPVLDVLSEDGDIETACAIIAHFSSVWEKSKYLPWVESNLDNLFSIEAGWKIVALTLNKNFTEEKVFEIKKELCSMNWRKLGCDRDSIIESANYLLSNLSDPSEIIQLYHTAFLPPFKYFERLRWFKGIVKIAGITALPNELISVLENLLHEDNPKREEISYQELRLIYELADKSKLPRVAGALSAIYGDPFPADRCYEFLETFSFLAMRSGAEKWQPSQDTNVISASVDKFWNADWNNAPPREFVEPAYIISSFYFRKPGPVRRRQVAFVEEFENSENQLIEIFQGRIISVPKAIFAQFHLFPHVLSIETAELVLRFPEDLLSYTEMWILEELLQNRGLSDFSFEHLFKIIRMAIFLQNSELLSRVKAYLMDSIRIERSNIAFIGDELRLSPRIANPWDFLFGLLKLPAMFYSLIPDFYEEALDLFYQRLFSFCRNVIFQEDIKKLSKDEIELIKVIPAKHKDKL